MSKILTDKNVADPGLNVLGAIIFFAAYLCIYYLMGFPCLLSEQFDILDNVFFHIVMQFFPAVGCFALGQVIANEIWAKRILIFAVILGIPAIVSIITYTVIQIM